MQDPRDDNQTTDAPDKQGGPAAPPAQGTLDSRYLAIVGALTVMIIVLLAWLWLHERVALNAARGQLVAARQRSALGMQLQAALGRSLAGPQTQPARPVQREDLPAETVNWNGVPRPVLRLSAEAGERIGLRPGDAVIVAPVTRPAATGPEAPRP
jgi:hypothetical protein